MAIDKPPPTILDRFRRLLAPPISPDDEYQTFAFRVLHYTLLLLIGIAAVLSLVSPSATQYIFLPALLFILLFCYFLMRVNRHQMAKVLFLAGLWSVVTIASFSLNGLRNAIISTYAIVIIYSAVLFSERAVILMTGLSVLSLVVLLAGENRGFLPLHTTPLSLTDRFFQQVALFGAAGVLLGAGARFIRAGYARIQHSEHLLRQRNRELETQISEREKTEAALKESEKRYRVIGEMISDFAYAYDIEPDGGTIPVWITGESFKRVTGYEWEETNTTFRLYHPDDMEKVRRHVRQTAQGQPTPGDYRIITKSGETRWVHVERRLERSETDGRPVRFYGSAQDITQNVRAKESILRLNQELENKAVQLAAINKIARDISAVTDLSSTLRRVLEKLQTLLPLDVFYVALHDPDTQIISFPVMYDMEQFWNQPPGTLSPSSWITQVLQTGQAMLLNRTPEQIEASRKTHRRLGAANQVSASILMAPLIIGSQNIGVISVQSYTPDAYHEKHLELLVDAGYQIAIAVENARLYDSLRNELAERKQAEEALRRSEALLRALLDATTDVAFLMSLDGTFLTLNKAIADAAGTTVEDLTGRSVFDLMKPELRESRRRQFETVIQTRQPQRWEDDTLTGWWDNSVYPVLSPSGSVEAFAVYSRNITEQKRLAAELQQHTARLEEMVEERTVQLRRAKDQTEIILNNIRDAVALAQPNGDIRTANPAFEALFGSHISQSIERILEAIGSDEHIVMVGSALIQAMQLQEQQHIEARITSTDGSSKDVDLTFIPVQLADETGQPGILVSAHDITHLKEIERFKARFIADAVHDLATPISGLSTRLYLLKRSPEKLDEHVCALENQVEHLRNLLADLRTLSQLDRGQLTLNLQTCDLNQIARRVFDTYEPVAITKQQTLKLDAEPSLPEVQLDRRQIERVLVNLVANAINYTPTGKSILMQTRSEAAGVIFGVTDEGIGIAAEELPYIFDRFYRTDRARQTQAGGTGLGLAIVREIIDLHGGTVIVTSEPGRGSTFSISLPIHRLASAE